MKQTEYLFKYLFVAAVAIRAASNNPTSIINATKRLSDLVPNIKGWCITVL